MRAWCARGDGGRPEVGMPVLAAPRQIRPRSVTYVNIPGPAGKLAMTAGSLLPVAPSLVGIPADQRETIHDISQEAPPLTAEPRSRPFHADLRLLQGETWRLVRNLKSFGRLRDLQVRRPRPPGLRIVRGRRWLLFLGARTKTAPSLLWCVGLPCSFADPPVPRQKGFIDDRYREFRP